VQREDKPLTGVLGRLLFGPSRLGLKTVFTACLGVTLFLALIYILWNTKWSIFITIAALLLAVPLDHGVRWMVAHGARRSLALVAVLSGLLALFAAVGWLIIPQIVFQVDRLVSEGPGLIERLRETPWYRGVDETFGLDRIISRSIAELREHPAEVAQRAFSVATVVVLLTAALLTVLAVATFMLIYGPHLVHWTIEQALPERRLRYRRGVERVYRALGGYIIGVSGIVAINAVTTVAFLAIMRVPFFLPLGVLSGLASLVPVLGVTITGALLSVVAAVTQGIWVGVATAIYITVYQQFENNVLGPLVYKRTVSINPLLSILMVLFLGELAGLVGAILAVPILAVGKIVVSELLLLRAEQRTAVARVQPVAATPSIVTPEPPDQGKGP
jgi:putative heme transporter